MEVLPGRQVYLCSPKKPTRPLLFFGSPIIRHAGIALRVRAKGLPVKKFVRMTIPPFAHDGLLEGWCGPHIAGGFVDGVVLAAADVFTRVASRNEAPCY